MKIINRYIVKEHFYPFIMALLALLFILLANFLLRSMDRFLGKGLDIILILEFVFLNLAWILALAVPMAILISTLMAFGRLSSDNEISALRSVSFSYLRLITPALMFSIIIACFMIYFNNQILPEMNHKARMLSSDISRKRPDLDFDIGYFIDAIPQYNFLLGSRDGKVFRDITIFSNREGSKQQTITSKSGTISSVDDGVLLNLVDGVIHEYMLNDKNEYREIFFDKYQVMIPVDNMVLNRKDSNIRGDREMTFFMMKDKINSYEEKIRRTLSRVQNRLNSEAEKLDIGLDLDTLSMVTPKIVAKTFAQFKLGIADSVKKIKEIRLLRVERRLKNLKRGIESDFSLIASYKNSINKYLVELHKKFSIPFASVVFVLIGAPLGMMAKKSGFAVSSVFSLGFFIIYWAFLIGGEEFADRGLLSPALSMWLPNIVLGSLGIIICYRMSIEQRVINLDIINIFKRRNGNKNDKRV